MADRDKLLKSIQDREDASRAARKKMWDTMDRSLPKATREEHARINERIERSARERAEIRKRIYSK